MMTREHHRRRSPASERRRRRSRRDSREHLQNHQMPVPAPYDAPNDSAALVLSRNISTSESEGSSTASSLVNISRENPLKAGLRSFFSTNSERPRHKVRKKRTRRLFGFGNSSSSSVGSDLAYGKGYINRRSRDFTPPGRHDHSKRAIEAAPPPQPDPTDEEILALGKQFADLARLQQKEDLRTAGRHRPAALLGAAAAASQFHRRRSGASSRPSQRSSDDDDNSEWESASEDESSSEDDGLVYGPGPHLPGSPNHRSESSLSARSGSSGLDFSPEVEPSLNRKPSLVDPRLFGPYNSLRGFVRTPCGFDEVDQRTVEAPREDPAGAFENASYEDMPLQRVYPVPTSDPARFDVGRGSIVSAAQEASSRSRPSPIPIQQPKPIVPVSSKLYNATESEAGEDRNSMGRSFAGAAAAAGLAGAALAGARSSDGREDRERPREERRESEREEKYRARQLNSQENNDKEEKRRSRDDYREDWHGKRRERRDTESYLPGDSGRKGAEPVRPDDRGRNGAEVVRPNDREQRLRDRYRDNDPPRPAHLDRDEPPRTEDQQREIKGARKDDRKEVPRAEEPAEEEKRERKSAGRGFRYDLSQYRRVEDPNRPSSQGPIDPFQFQVADDAFPTPKNATPQRPLTPNVVTVEREPDFSGLKLTEADKNPPPRMSRRDSYEHDLDRTKRVREEPKQPSAPLDNAAAATENHRGRSSSRGGDLSSRNRSPRTSHPRDTVQEEADRHYREQRMAQRVNENHSRDSTPERSVIDKWQDAPEQPQHPQVIEIVAPPDVEGRTEAKNPYDKPNADVRIDNILSPTELVVYQASDRRGEGPLLVRDPSAERARPTLNLVQPTPVPSPLPEQQEPTAPIAREPKKPPPVDVAAAQPAPDAVIEPRGDVVATPGTPSSKVVSWGENETKHYVAESPVRVRDVDPSSSAPIIIPAETPKARSGRRNKKSKSNAWEFITSAIGGGSDATGAAPSASVSAVEPNKPQPRAPLRSEPSSAFSFEDLGEEPPAVGPKPALPRGQKTPGAFTEDLDFAATIAAGLEDSGFDPDIVFKDASYHKRNSPPGSNEPGNYHAPFVETVPDLGTDGQPEAARGKTQEHGYVIGELAATPAEEKAAHSSRSPAYPLQSATGKPETEKPADSKNFDRSEIIVIEDEADELPPATIGDQGCHPATKPSKREQKRKDATVEFNQLQGNTSAGSASPKDSERTDTTTADAWKDTPQKPKSRKPEAIVLQDEANPVGTEPQSARTSAPVDDIRSTQQAKNVPVDDEWSNPRKAMKNPNRYSDTPTVPSRSVSPQKQSSGDTRRTTDLQNLPKPSEELSKPRDSVEQPKDSVATEILSIPSPTSEPPESPNWRRAGDDFSALEAMTDLFDWDTEPTPIKLKHDTEYHSPPRSTPRSDPFSDANAMPHDASTTPEGSSKNKKSRREWVAFDKPLESIKPVQDPTGHEAPSGSQSTSRVWPGGPGQTPRRASRASSLPRAESYSGTPDRESHAAALARSGSYNGVTKKERTNPFSRFGIGGDKDKRASDDDVVGGEPPDRGRKKEPLDKDDPRAQAYRRANTFNNLDDIRSLASGSSGSRKDKAKSEKDKDKKNSAGPRLFNRFKSSIGMAEEKDRPRKSEDSKRSMDEPERPRKSEDGKKNSFLDNAGTLGAGAGLAGAAAAAAAAACQNATDVASEKEAHSIPNTPQRRSPSPDESDINDPEIVQREIRPAIDPQYGDLLPLPPSAPGSPTPETDELPALPDSRPQTPEHDRQHLHELRGKPTHVRRKSANETPVNFKTHSQSAIPIQFRLAPRPSSASPNLRRTSSPASSPPTNDVFFYPKGRTPYPPSWSNGTRSLKPLSLVAKTSKESLRPPTAPDGGSAQIDWYEPMNIGGQGFDPVRESQRRQANMAEFPLGINMLGPASSEPRRAPAGFPFTSFMAAHMDSLAFGPADIPLPAAEDGELDLTPQDVPLPAATDEELEPASRDVPLAVTHIGESQPEPRDISLPLAIDGELEADPREVPLPPVTDGELDVDPRYIPLPAANDRELVIETRDLAIKPQDVALSPVRGGELDTKPDDVALQLALEDEPRTKSSDEEFNSGPRDVPVLSALNRGRTTKSTDTPLPAGVDSKLDIDPCDVPLPDVDEVELQGNRWEESVVELKRRFGHLMNPRIKFSEQRTKRQASSLHSTPSSGNATPAARDDRQLHLQASRTAALQKNPLASIEMAVIRDRLKSLTPAPVDPMSKDRSSYLLHRSSPSSLPVIRAPVSAKEVDAKLVDIPEQAADVKPNSEHHLKSITGPTMVAASSTALPRNADDPVRLIDSSKPDSLAKEEAEKTNAMSLAQDEASPFTEDLGQDDSDVPLPLAIDSELEVNPRDVPLPVAKARELEIEPQDVPLPPATAFELEADPRDIPLPVYIEEELEVDPRHVPLPPATAKELEADPRDIPLPTFIKGELDADPRDIPLPPFKACELEIEPQDVPLPPAIAKELEADPQDIPLPAFKEGELEADPRDIPLPPFKAGEFEVDPCYVPLLPATVTELEVNPQDIPLPAFVEGESGAEPQDIPLPAALDKELDINPKDVPLPPFIKEDLEADPQFVQLPSATEGELDVEPTDVALPPVLESELDVEPADVALPPALESELDVEPADVALPLAFDGELDVEPADVALPPAFDGELHIEPADVALPPAFDGELHIEPADVALPPAFDGELHIEPADVALPPAFDGELHIEPADVALPATLRGELGELDIEPFDVALPPAFEGELDAEPQDVALPPPLKGELDVEPQDVVLPAAVEGELNIEPQDVALPVALQGELDIEPFDIALPSAFEGELDIEPQDVALSPAFDGDVLIAPGPVLSTMTNDTSRSDPRESAPMPSTAPLKDKRMSSAPNGSGKTPPFANEGMSVIADGHISPPPAEQTRSEGEVTQSTVDISDIKNYAPNQIVAPATFSKETNVVITPLDQEPRSPTGSGESDLQAGENFTSEPSRIANQVAVQADTQNGTDPVDRSASGWEMPASFGNPGTDMEYATELEAENADIDTWLAQEDPIPQIGGSRAEVQSPPDSLPDVGSKVVPDDSETQAGERAVSILQIQVQPEAESKSFAVLPSEENQEEQRISATGVHMPDTAHESSATQQRSKEDSNATEAEDTASASVEDDELPKMTHSSPSATMQHVTHTMAMEQTQAEDPTIRLHLQDSGPQASVSLQEEEGVDPTMSSSMDLRTAGHTPQDDAVTGRGSPSQTSEQVDRVLKKGEGEEAKRHLILNRRHSDNLPSEAAHPLLVTDEGAPPDQQESEEPREPAILGSPAPMGEIASTAVSPKVQLVAMSDMHPEEQQSSMMVVEDAQTGGQEKLAEVLKEPTQNEGNGPPLEDVPRYLIPQCPPGQSEGQREHSEDAGPKTFQDQPWERVLDRSSDQIQDGPQDGPLDGARQEIHEDVVSTEPPLSPTASKKGRRKRRGKKARSLGAESGMASSVVEGGPSLELAATRKQQEALEHETETAPWPEDKLDRGQDRVPRADKADDSRVSDEPLVWHDAEESQQGMQAVNPQAGISTGDRELAAKLSDVVFEDAAPSQSQTPGGDGPGSRRPSFVATGLQTGDAVYFPSAPVIHQMQTTVPRAQDGRSYNYFPSATAMLGRGGGFLGNGVEVAEKTPEGPSVDTRRAQADEAEAEGKEENDGAEQRRRRGSEGSALHSRGRSTPPHAEDGLDLVSDKSPETTPLAKVEDAPPSQPSRSSGEDEVQLAQPGPVIKAPPEAPPAVTAPPSSAAAAAAAAASGADQPPPPLAGLGAGDITTTHGSRAEGPVAGNPLDLFLPHDPAGTADSNKAAKTSNEKRQSISEEPLESPAVSLDGPTASSPPRAPSVVDEPGQTAESAEPSEPGLVEQQPSDDDRSTAMAKKSKKGRQAPAAVVPVEPVPTSQEPDPSEASRDHAPAHDGSSDPAVPARGADEAEPDEEWSAAKPTKKDKKKKKKRGEAADIDPDASEAPLVPPDPEPQSVTDETPSIARVPTEPPSGSLEQESRAQLPNVPAIVTSTDQTLDPDPDSDPEPATLSPPVGQGLFGLFSRFQSPVSTGIGMRHASASGYPRRPSFRASFDAAAWAAQEALSRPQSPNPDLMDKRQRSTTLPDTTSRHLDQEGASVRNTFLVPPRTENAIEDDDDEYEEGPGKDHHSGIAETTSALMQGGTSPATAAPKVETAAELPVRELIMTTEAEPADNHQDLPQDGDLASSSPKQSKKDKRKKKKRASQVQEGSVTEAPISEQSATGGLVFGNPFSSAIDPEGSQSPSEPRSLPPKEATPVDQPTEESQPQEEAVGVVAKMPEEDEKTTDSQTKQPGPTLMPTPSEQPEPPFLAPGQPSEKEPSATEHWVTEQSARPNDEQPVEELPKDGAIVANDATLEAGLEANQVAPKTPVLEDSEHFSVPTALMQGLQLAADNQVQGNGLQASSIATDPTAVRKAPVGGDEDAATTQVSKQNDKIQDALSVPAEEPVSELKNTPEPVASKAPTSSLEETVPGHAFSTMSENRTSAEDPMKPESIPIPLSTRETEVTPLAALVPEPQFSEPELPPGVAACSDVSGSAPVHWGGEEESAAGSDVHDDRGAQSTLNVRTRSPDMAADEDRVAGLQSSPTQQLSGPPTIDTDEPSLFRAHERTGSSEAINDLNNDSSEGARRSLFPPSGKHVVEQTPTVSRDTPREGPEVPVTKKSKTKQERQDSVQAELEPEPVTEVAAEDAVTNPEAKTDATVANTDRGVHPERPMDKTKMGMGTQLPSLTDPAFMPAEVELIANQELPRKPLISEQAPEDLKPDDNTSASDQTAALESVQDDEVESQPAPAHEEQPTQQSQDEMPATKMSGGNNASLHQNSKRIMSGTTATEGVPPSSDGESAESDFGTTSNEVNNEPAYIGEAQQPGPTSLAVPIDSVMNQEVAHAQTVPDVSERKIVESVVVENPTAVQEKAQDTAVGELEPSNSDTIAPPASTESQPSDDVAIHKEKPTTSSPLPDSTATTPWSAQDSGSKSVVDSAGAHQPISSDATVLSDKFLPGMAPESSRDVLSDVMLIAPPSTRDDSTESPRASSSKDPVKGILPIIPKRPKRAWRKRNPSGSIEISPAQMDPVETVASPGDFIGPAGLAGPSHQTGAENNIAGKSTSSDSAAVGSILPGSTCAEFVSAEDSRHDFPAKGLGTGGQGNQSTILAESEPSDFVASEKKADVDEASLQTQPDQTEPAFPVPGEEAKELDLSSPVVTFINDDWSGAPTEPKLDRKEVESQTIAEPPTEKRPSPPSETASTLDEEPTEWTGPADTLPDQAFLSDSDFAGSSRLGKETSLRPTTPMTPPPPQMMSAPVEIDTSPAQLGSHVDHDAPFDQTQPDKKAPTRAFLNEEIVSTPISAPTQLAALYLEDRSHESPTYSEPRAALDNSGNIADSVARDITASYLAQTPAGEASHYPQSPSKGASGSGSAEGKVPSAHDIATSYLESQGRSAGKLLPPMTLQRAPAASHSHTAVNDEQEHSREKKQEKPGEGLTGDSRLERPAPTGAGEGQVAKMAARFTGPTNDKDKKGRIHSEQNAPRNDGDSPVLDENSTLGVAGERAVLGADWNSPREISDKVAENLGIHTVKKQTPIHARQLIEMGSDLPESPIVGRGGQESKSDQARSMARHKAAGKEASRKEPAPSSELIRDIEELDTSEAHQDEDDASDAHTTHQLTPSTAGSSHDAMDWARGSTLSARSLPPVEEETHEDLERDMQSTGGHSNTQGTSEINRDSGFTADSPHPLRRSVIEDAGQRDSGVHLAEGAANKREGLSPPSEASARHSWTSTESRGSPAPPAEERRAGRSPLGDEAPRLRQYSLGSGSKSPDPDGANKVDPQKLRTVTPQMRPKRSVSENVSRFEEMGHEVDGKEARRSASNTSMSRLRTPEPLKLLPDSPGSRSLRSSGTNTPPLRSRRMGGDLRSQSQTSLRSVSVTDTTDQDQDHDHDKDPADRPAIRNTTPVANEGRVRAKDMADVYDGVGEGRMGSPRSPTRPHSMRRRQSMQVLELESKVEQLLMENRMLNEARQQAETHGHQRAAVTITERDAEIEQLKGLLEGMRREVQRLAEVNDGLNSANAQLAHQHNDRYNRLESQHQSANHELEQYRTQYTRALREKDGEIQELRQQLAATQDQVRQLQQQILASKPADADFLRLRDEDHFDHRCQQLCAHVQQWVLRFSKFSDMRACRLTGEINDEKIIDRLDNSMLDGTDVDEYLGDRVRRRDVFMSMTMNMIWEFVFTRYLFGMDREQRQKLKSLEKLLSEVGPPQAVRQWRAVTLTLLSKRPAFGNQRNEDTEAVVQAILQTLSMILPPPSNLEDQIQSQLRRVMREAVDLSIEMRTQRGEYMMLPPLQPQYDANGDIAETVYFNAALMNERSGGSVSNQELEAQGAVVRSVLFPLVVKKGDDNGLGDDEIVIFPAQVLVAKPKPATIRMVTPSSEMSAAPGSRGTTPSVLSKSATPSVLSRSATSLPMTPQSPGPHPKTR